MKKILPLILFLFFGVNSGVASFLPIAVGEKMVFIESGTSKVVSSENYYQLGSKYRFVDGVSFVRTTEDQWDVQLVGTDFKKIAGPFSGGYPLHEGLAFAGNPAGKYGFIDKTGTFVIPPMCVFRPNPATIPTGKRPPFRRESGRHSDSIAATIPEQSGQRDMRV